MNVYEVITARIIERMRQGTIPWRKPWVSMPAANWVSKKPFRGMNVLMTSLAGFSSPWWLSFPQVVAAGGKVRKGEKGFPIVFCKFVDYEDDKEDSRRIPYYRYTTEFNAEQIDGIDFGEKQVPLLDEPEGIIAGYKDCPKIIPGNRASYNPATDVVSIPPIGNFNNPDAYYCTLYHELVHSTGSQSRLAREMNTTFGSEVYSKEELIAEIGSSFLCDKVGILNESVLSHQAGYLDHWIKRLRSDSRLIISAASHAQKAVDYITGKDVSYE